MEAEMKTIIETKYEPYKNPDNKESQEAGSINKTIFNFIKTPCGQAKYIELEANKTLLGKLRLLWFILIASIRDWNIKE